MCCQNRSRLPHVVPDYFSRTNWADYQPFGFLSGSLGAMKVKFWWRLREVRVDETAPLTPGILPLLDSPWPGGRTASRHESFSSATGTVDVSACISYESITISLLPSKATSRVEQDESPLKKAFKYKAEEREVFFLKKREDDLWQLNFKRVMMIISCRKKNILKPSQSWTIFLFCFGDLSVLFLDRLNRWSKL